MSRVVQKSGRGRHIGALAFESNEPERSIVPGSRSGYLVRSKLAWIEVPEGMEQYERAAPTGSGPKA